MTASFVLRWLSRLRRLTFHSHRERVTYEQRGTVAASVPDKTSPGSESLLFILVLLTALGF